LYCSHLELVFGEFTQNVLFIVIFTQYVYDYCNQRGTSFLHRSNKYNIFLKKSVFLSAPWMH